MNSALRIGLFLTTLVGLGYALGLYLRTEKGETFYIVLDEIPQKLTRGLSFYVQGTTITEQLYSPLFYHDRKGMRSKVVAKNHVGDNFKTFTLCLKPNATFNSGKRIEPQDLIANFKDFIRYDLLPMWEKAEVEGRCLHLSFAKPCFRFMHNLQRVQSFIVDPNTQNDRVPIGFSSYRVAKYTKDRLELEFIGKGQRPHFDRIAYVTKDVPDLPEVPHEINHMFIGNRKPFITEAYKPYRPFNKNRLFLVLNVRQNRAKLAACIPTAAIARIYEEEMQTEGRVEAKNSLIPYGLMGAVNDSFGQVDCEPGAVPKLTFYNIYPKANARLQEVFARAGLDIEVQHIPISMMREKTSTKENSIFFWGYASNDSEAYLTPFFSNKPVSRIADVLPESDRRRLWANIQAQTNLDDYRHALAEANRYLCTEHYVLPLFSYRLIFYYPIRLKGIESAVSSRHGFYRVKDLTW